MIKKITKVYVMLCLSACAVAPTLKVTSNVPARIEKDGKTICKTTPCVIIGHYFGPSDDDCRSGTYTMLEAFPLDKKQGYTQLKNVLGQCDEQSNVFFDMESRSGVRTLNDDK